MELEGLKRSLTDIEEKGVDYKHLVTDRHTGVKKFMREQRPTKNHWYDGFHVAKCKIIMLIM